MSHVDTGGDGVAERVVQDADPGGLRAVESVLLAAVRHRPPGRLVRLVRVRGQGALLLLVCVCVCVRLFQRLFKLVRLSVAHGWVSKAEVVVTQPLVPGWSRCCTRSAAGRTARTRESKTSGRACRCSGVRHARRGKILHLGPQFPEGVRHLAVLQVPEGLSQFGHLIASRS